MTPREGKMDIKSKIGQMMMVGFDGYIVNDHIRNMIIEYKIGSVILFQRNCKNTKQVFELIYDLQKLSVEYNGVPLFIAIDQENGVVRRIYEGIPTFCGNMAQTAGATIQETEKIGYLTGWGLGLLGFNLNLAPSVDVNNNEANPVINVRSFGPCPQVVAERGVACIKGMQQSGIIATAKHFPGHGDTSVDSHLDLPTVPYDKERLNQIELLPFVAAIKAGVKAIMTSHIKFPAYEEEDLPATLSKNILTDLLRTQLGFDGLILTDCMEMKAIDTYYQTVWACKKAVMAGVDILCVSHSEEKQRKAIDLICDGVTSNEIAMEQIDASVDRILKHKQEMGFDITKKYDDILPLLNNEEYKGFSRHISLKSMTIMKNQGLIPLKGKKVTIIAPLAIPRIGENGEMAVQSFADRFKKTAIDFDVAVVESSFNPNEDLIERAVENAKNAEVVILCSYNALNYVSQQNLIEEVAKVNKNIILIPLRNPYDYKICNDVGACLVPYEYSENAIECLIDVLLGKEEATGVFPVIKEI